MNEKIETAGTTTTSSPFGLIRYVHTMFIGGVFLVGWLLTQVIETTWTSLNLSITVVPPPSYWISVAGASVVSIAAGLYLWRHPKVNRLAVEIVSELSKVSWPTRKELYQSTIVVIILSIIAAVIIGLFDGFWSWFTDKIFSTRA